MLALAWQLQCPISHLTLIISFAVQLRMLSAVVVDRGDGSISQQRNAINNPGVIARVCTTWQIKACCLESSCSRAGRARPLSLPLVFTTALNGFYVWTTISSASGGRVGWGGVGWGVFFKAAKPHQKQGNNSGWYAYLPASYLCSSAIAGRP